MCFIVRAGEATFVVAAGGLIKFKVEVRNAGGVRVGAGLLNTEHDVYLSKFYISIYLLTLISAPL